MSTEKKSSLESLAPEISKSKMNWQRAIVWIFLIIAVATVAIFASCASTHRVSQSASTYRSGDTLTTTIIYQQTGSLKKR